MYKLLLLCLITFPVVAQTGVADGSIRGTIHDSSNAPVSSASVNAKNLETGFERNAVSNQVGDFEVPLLLPGRYEVSISVNGFAPFRQTGIEKIARRAVGSFIQQSAERSLLFAELPFGDLHR